MAELLKREYDIIVLKVELLSNPQERGNVRFTFQCKIDGVLTDIFTDTSNTSAMGLSGWRQANSSFRGELPVVLPDYLLGELKNWFERETNGDRPLWVHLVSPYGALRFVPWEKILVPALSVPVLMLPDFIFPPPREAVDVLDVVLCASAPLHCEEAWVYQTMLKAVDKIVQSAVKGLRLHVFVDYQSRQVLEDFCKTRGWLDQIVFIHSHQLAEKYVTGEVASPRLETSGSLRSPWLLWMREALSGKTVDVVHFICHGYVCYDNGALLFAQSPLERTERYLAGPVGFVELQNFLTQVGAWATVFTSVPDNFSQIGLRALADEVAQNRPGPMMMQDTSNDPECEALRMGYRFLFGSPEVQPPPKSDALFIYCQPYLIPDSGVQPAGVRGGGRRQKKFSMPERARSNLQARLIMATEASLSPLEAHFEGTENATPLAAVTERFAEQIQLRYQKLARDGILGEKIGGAHADAAADILAKLRDVVASQSMPEGLISSEGSAPMMQGGEVAE